MTSCIPDDLRQLAKPTTATGDDNAVGDTPAPAAPASAATDTTSSDEAAHAKSSIFARDENAPVHVVPMRVIHRPLPSELDESKVQSFMKEMQAGDVFTPIEVIKVRAPLKTDPNGTVQNFYFSMGGCHRYEATKRLGLPNIRARIIEVPPAAMRMYLGAGSPF
ncbi:hypothetical protein VHUM_01836 [Vanrija humicola]|uniref:sulfiredoxin n=1 Tax=Vanrija humicola TaxID=5417 RepID=A0A7D8V2Z3_VANHU|nr:hypothetical protein VHUM_01836 [Vanrija humicola]